jgi:hypothetical protein
MPAAVIASPPFRARMRETRKFLVEVKAIHVYHQLLIDLEQIVFPNLATFPFIGKLWLDGKVQSTEALMAIAKLPRDADRGLRQYVHGDFTLLYAASADTIHLVSIRHHRESTFIP